MGREEERGRERERWIMKRRMTTWKRGRRAALRVSFIKSERASERASSPSSARVRAAPSIHSPSFSSSPPPNHPSPGSPSPSPSTPSSSHLFAAAAAAASPFFSSVVVVFVFCAGMHKISFVRSFGLSLVLLPLSLVHSSFFPSFLPSFLSPSPSLPPAELTTPRNGP